MKHRKSNQTQIALSDEEIRLRTLELVQNTYACNNPFELIARSAALARYVKTGKYNRSSGDIKEICDDYLARIYKELAEKRYEPKQPTNNTNNKSDIPKPDVPLFKKLFSCFRDE